MEDELRREYNLKALKVRKLGPQRQQFGKQIIKLDEDVAEIFTKKMGLKPGRSRRL